MSTGLLSPIPDERRLFLTTIESIVFPWTILLFSLACSQRYDPTGDFFWVTVPLQLTWAFASLAFFADPTANPLFRLGHNSRTFFWLMGAAGVFCFAQLAVELIHPLVKPGTGPSIEVLWAIALIGFIALKIRGDRKLFGKPKAGITA